MSVSTNVYYDFIYSVKSEIASKYLALTDKESDYISRTEGVISSASAKFIIIDSDGKKKLALPENFHDILLQEMKNNRLSLTKAETITSKAFSGKWYTLILAGDKEEDMEQTSFYLLSDKSKDQAVYLNNESPYYKLFDEQGITAEDYCLKERKMLGLSSDYKFISSSEYFTLQRIAFIKNMNAERGTISGNWKIKSSPMLILPVKIGKVAVLSATEGKMKDRGKMFLSVGNYQCSYTPNKAASSFLKGNVNAQKLLDTIQHEAYLSGYKTSRLRIPLKKILEIRGLKDMKELKKQVASASALLDDMSFTGKLGGGDYDKISITQGDTSIIRGYLCVNISEKFLEGLRNAKQEMLYNPELQKLPSMGFSYGFARLFEEHKRRNAGKPNNIENRLSILTLLEASPYPIYSEMKDKGQAGQKIIEPFLKCFDRIEEQGIFSYRLCKQGGEPLTDEENSRFLTDYPFFSTLLVEVHYFKEPDYSGVVDLKAKANGARAAKEHKANEPLQARRKPGRPKKNSSPALPDAEKQATKTEETQEGHKPEEAKRGRKKHYWLQKN